MIKFDSETCQNLESASSREWLETNGLGGYASSTITGMNTRRYHGLLVAALAPPVGRSVLLSRFEEALIINGRRVDLSTNCYPGVIHPTGYLHLKSFRLDPFPIFTFVSDGIEVEKSLFMIHGRDATVTRYEVNTPTAMNCVLEVRPLIAFRDFHSLMRENSELDRAVQNESGLISIQPYSSLPRLYFAHNAGAVDGAGFWYRNFQYKEERRRGFDFAEDLYSPFALSFTLGESGRCADLITSTEPYEIGFVSEHRQSEITRREAISAMAPSNEEFARSLTVAADQFLVSRGKGSTIIAGYHWFGDWGRDTMISLPGLTLATGREDVARDILREFAGQVNRGMLPNRFPDEGFEPEYNTVDATLWFFEAVRAFRQHTSDLAFVREHLYDVLKDIIEWHTRGTRYGIVVDGDGLLSAGEEGVQLTWMDAKVGDYVVTPRHGKPVEIQALWYNTLKIIENISCAFGDDESASRYGVMAETAKRSFNEQFWNPAAGCLFDVVDGDRQDGSIRPNQIFAVSLAHSMLNKERARQVVTVVERELLTPYGLRSLAVSEIQYRGRYEGDSWSRDTSYHQGAVWAWLIGPFIAAYLGVNDGAEESKIRARELLRSFETHLEEAGLGQVSEIFDGDAPHSPRGCIAQAWSIGELLRALSELRG